MFETLSKTDITVCRLYTNDYICTNNYFMLTNVKDALPLLFVLLINVQISRNNVKLKKGLPSAI